MPGAAGLPFARAGAGGTEQAALRPGRGPGFGGKRRSALCRPARAGTPVPLRPRVPLPLLGRLGPQPAGPGGRPRRAHRPLGRFAPRLRQARCEDLWPGRFGPLLWPRPGWGGAGRSPPIPPALPQPGAGGHFGAGGAAWAGSAPFGKASQKTAGPAGAPGL